MRRDIDLRKEEILDMISSNKSMAQMCITLRCRYDTLKRYFNRAGIQYSGNQPRKGLPRPNKSAAEYLFYGSCIHSSNLKKKLFSEGIKEKKCESCGIVKWMGRAAPLELDHIDGDRFNNAIENLRILCANCHSQTPTNSGRNRGSYVK